MALLIPRAKTLLSYVGRLTSARTSPVCGFMTITTPRLMPTSFIAHFIAFWAYCCSFVSIVSVSELPGRASVSVWRVCVLRPDPSRSTLSVP